jgi:hypothetical protein
MTDQSNYYQLMERKALSAPIPARTDTYSPVTHAEIIEAMKSRLKHNNLSVEKNRVYSNSHGTRVVGFFDVIDGSELGKEHGMQMMLGYRNSYDKSMSVAFAAGATVWICENGCISGDLLAFRRKHTGTVASELADKIQTGIDRMRDDFGRLLIEVDIMKNYSLTPRQKAEILGVMYFERNIVSPTQLSIVKHELKHSHNFKEDNAWSLYNNVTESLKRSHPITIIPDHIKVHGFMKEMCGMSAVGSLPETDVESTVEG